MLKIDIIRTESGKDLPLPSYATEGSSGMDLYADVEDSITIMPGGISLISSGIRLGLPPGYEAQVRPRSGLALKHGIGMVNAPGTIDADYRGVISVILINHGKRPFVVKRGDRIAQIVVKPVIKVEWSEKRELDQTVRSCGGFGHSGI